MCNYTGNIILCTRNEVPPDYHLATPLLYDDEILGRHPTVVAGMILQKLGSLECEELVMGVDPGSRIGLSVFYYEKEIESSLHSSIDGLVAHIIEVLAGLRAKKKVVKIGNGDMQIARKIGASLNLKFCSSFELEFVDEHSTSPRFKNYNQGGKRDRLSAKYISQRQGRRQSILPLSMTG